MANGHFVFGFKKTFWAPNKNVLFRFQHVDDDFFFDLSTLFTFNRALELLKRLSLEVISLNLPLIKI